MVYSEQWISNPRKCSDSKCQTQARASLSTTQKMDPSQIFILQDFTTTKKGFPKYVMVSRGMSKLGKTSLLFVESGTKINSDLYQELLNQMLPSYSALANDQPFIFQQDGSRSHTLALTLAYFAEHADDCELLPPNGLQSLRTSNRVTIASGTNWTQVCTSACSPENVEEMKAHLFRVWDQLPQQQ